MKYRVIKTAIIYLFTLSTVFLSACSYRQPSLYYWRDLIEMEVSYDPRLSVDQNYCQIVDGSYCKKINGAIDYYDGETQQYYSVDASTSKFVLTNEAMVFLSGYCLFEYREGKRMHIAEDVADFSWDGERIVYCDYEGNVFALDRDLECELLFRDPGQRRDMDSFYDVMLLATQDWIVLCNGTTSITYVFSNIDHSLNSYYNLADIYNAENFLYQNWLIMWGYSEHGAQLMDLQTGQITPIDLQFDSREHSATASVCVYQEKLIVSCEILPWTHVTRTKLTGTYVLDCETSSVEKIDEFYNIAMISTGDNLLGVGEYERIYNILPMGDKRQTNY